MFTLGHLDDALSVCMGAFRRCPLYHRLRSETALTTVDGELSGPRAPLHTVHASSPCAPLPGRLTGSSAATDHPARSAPQLRLVGQSDRPLNPAAAPGRRPRTDVLIHLTRNGRRVALGATGS